MPKPWDLENFQDPGKWPAWPYLPVKHTAKRDGAFPVLGLIVEDEDYQRGKIKIYATSLFDRDFTKQPIGEYPSMRAAQMDGWTVD